MELLIVEPSKLFQQMLEALFKDVVTEVVVSEKGMAALELLGRRKFDLVCIARELGDMDGLEFARDLREHGQRSCTPLVMISAERTPELIKAALASGITEVFHKSELDELRDYIDDLDERLAGDDRLQGRVLCVEDSPTMAAIFKGTLEDMGLSVDHVMSAEEGLLQFRENDYQLIITDVVLAGDMSGIGLTRMIRHSAGKKSRVPILATSGMDDTARRIELLRSGANDYVPKPLIEEEFRARVKNLVLNQQLMDKVDEQQQRLQQMAMTDQLTTLYNRHYLVEIIPQMLSSARRHAYDVSLVIIDLDHFKAINDTHGHAVGDKVLTRAASLLKNQCRKEDVAARIGGEEFVLVLSHCTLDDACKKAETLRQQLVELRPAGIDISASFGVASLCGGDYEDYEALFQAADRAVYRAKEAGRNRVKRADEPVGGTVPASQGVPLRH